MSESADDEFCVECSDDENYGLETIQGECCHPAPDQLTKLMQELTQKAYLELKWECIGRKSPSDFAAEDADLCDETEDAVNDIEEPEKCKEFDFDDFSDNPRFAPRRNLTNQKLKGSGQRRVANFSSVVSNMRRHMKKDTFEMKKNNTENAKKRLLFSSGVKL